MSEIYKQAGLVSSFKKGVGKAKNLIKNPITGRGKINKAVKDEAKRVAVGKNLNKNQMKDVTKANRQRMAAGMNASGVNVSRGKSSSVNKKPTTGSVTTNIAAGNKASDIKLDGDAGASRRIGGVSDTAKDLGKSVKEFGKSVGGAIKDRAKKNPVAAGALGATATIGAGLGAKKLYDSKKKKQQESNSASNANI